MKLYKFRSFHELAYLLDILVMRRLYCAQPATLNDPFEGVYMSTRKLRERSLFKGVPRPRSIWAPGEPGEHMRVCSLSASMRDVRVWANYADGLRGVAIEVDIPETDARLRRVDYVTTLAEHAVHLLDPLPNALKILTTKTYHWQHEAEYRLIQPEPYFALSDAPLRVFVGTRIDEGDAGKARLAMLERFEGSGVQIVPTLLNSATLEVHSTATSDQSSD